MKASKRRNLESALTKSERALTAARSEFPALQRANKDLEARLHELEAELERRPPEAPLNGGAPVTDPDPELRDSLSREWQLARRVAELEAAHSVDLPPSQSEMDALQLREEIERLSLQLDVARTREDELALRAVRAERTLAQTGSRLAALGQRADQAERLESTLLELREASEHAAEEARGQIEEIRKELDGALVRVSELESDLSTSQAAREAASEAAAASEDRLRSLEAELGAANDLLHHVEEVFTGVRDRVDHPRATVVVAGAEVSEPSGPLDTVRYLEPGDLIAIADREYGAEATADLSAITEALASPAALDVNRDPAFPGLCLKAVVLLSELIVRRPYLQGNRRIALLATLHFLDLNGVVVDGGEDAMSDLALAVEARIPLPSITATLEGLIAPRSGVTPGDVRVPGQSDALGTDTS